MRKRIDLPDPPAVQAFDAAMVLDGDVGGGVVICADLHVPATDWTMAHRVGLVGKKLLKRPRRLVIAGDIFNLDAMSKWPQLVPTTDFATEQAAARYAIDMWERVFDEIYVIPGNHDKRFLNVFRGVFPEQTLIDVFGALLKVDGRIRYSLYSWLTITCAATGDWLVTHPWEYSQIILSKARKMATRYSSHVILPHQHYAALGVHENGKNVVVDLPALVDPLKLAYVQLDRRSNPAQQTGFGAIVNGAFQLFTANEALTDWSRYDTA